LPALHLHVFFLLKKISTDVFKFDPEYLVNEEKYAELKREILGESGDDDDGEEEEGDEEEAEEENAAGAVVAAGQPGSGTVAIRDMTSTDVINLRKTIYLTIMNSLDFEECCHKLLKMRLHDGQEVRL
jgi:pre-mRNA-splicing factor CWC22